MRLAELQAAGRHPQLPLRVTLADGAGAAELRLDSLLRVLPGQRYVGAGEWRGRKVLASCWWAARPHGISSANWKGRVCSRPRG